MKQRKKLGRKILGVLLTLAMIIGLMPGMSLTAYAEGTAVDLSTLTGNYTAKDGDVLSGTASDKTVTIPAGATVTLNGVNISSGSITCDGSVTMILIGANTVTATSEKAAIKIGGSGTTLTITGSGSLTAQGGSNSESSPGGGAGIGMDYTNDGTLSGGNIVINGGTVIATGGRCGAGIGTGPAEDPASITCGDITINGGTVIATGGLGAAGIGTGVSMGDNASNECGAITIGTGVISVTATKGQYSPNSIGKGDVDYGTQTCGTITIGGTIYWDGSAYQNGGDTYLATSPLMFERSLIAQTVTPPTAATDLTYKKDQAQALLTSGASVTTGNTAEGSIQYKVGTDGTWSTEIPKATNAGTYNVYYKVLGDDTYAEYAPTEPISVTIAKADPETPTGITAKYCDYTGIIKLPDGWTWQDDWYFFETVGTDTCKADFAGNDNYNAMTGVDITVAVEKADAAISYEKTEVSVEYGAEFSQNEITNPGDADPTFTSSNESVATVSKTGYVIVKGIGETTIKATIEDNEHYHYTTTEASYKLTVNPVKTVVNTAPTAAELTYGQKLSESTLTGGAAVCHGSSVAGTFAWKEPDLVPNASESGEYDVVFTPTDTKYAKSTCKVTIKVNKKTVPATDLEDAQKPVAKTGDDTVYTGEPIELITAPTTDLPLDYEAYYSTDNGETWSTDIPKKTDPGTYTVKVKYVSKGGNCNDIILDNITATIAPADKKALNDAIAAAKAYYDTIKGNTDYSEAAEKLDKAIKAAEEVAKADKVTKADVSAAAEAVTKAKATAEAEVKDIDDTKAAQAVIDKINELKPVENIKPEDRTKIEAVREAYKNLSDDQKTKLTGLDSTAVSTLEDAEKALDTAEKVAFDAEKEAEKKAADALAAEGDSDASKKLIEDAKKAIDALVYDETKSLDENKKAVAAILTKLKDDLTTQRAADKKEADDTEAAKKVTDAINALPASNKIATTDKAAIEAARKAYDALTADQKKKVTADVLKKLEAAEKALAEAEAKDKAAKALAAAKKEAQAAMNAEVKVTAKGKKIKIKWTKSKSADGYDVYVQYCGKKNKKAAKVIKKNSITKATIKKINGKKLNLKKQFKVYVVAYKMIDGKKVTLAKSNVGHVVGTKNKKYTNVKSIKLTKKAYTVAVGKTAKIKAKIKLVDKKKKHIPKSHGAKFRYRTSDSSIATVSKSGQIKGIKKGTCTIYVYAINGKMKKVKVTVK